MPKTKSTKHGPPSLARIPSGPLVTRFTKQQQELAEKISNDISEDIDCGENRQLLRMAVAFYADLACQNLCHYETAKFELLKLRLSNVLPDMFLEK